MTRWRLEWLRLVRTRRWVVLLATFSLFGLLGPFVAKYLPDLLKGSGSGIVIVVPPPVPADGVAQYLKNAMSIGLIVVVLVAALAMAVDAKPTLSVFYRTRYRRPADLLLPRLAVVSAAVTGAFCIGLLCAWYETSVLIGGLPAGRLLLGALLEVLYLWFALAAVTLAATLVRTALPAAGVVLAALLLLPVLGTLGGVGRYLPSALTGGLDTLIRVHHPPGFAAAAVVTAGAIVAMVAGSLALFNRREL